MLPFACQRLLKRVSQMAQDVLLLVTWETNHAMACPSYKDLPMRERERERETDRQADRQTDRQRQRGREREGEESDTLEGKGGFFSCVT